MLPFRRLSVYLDCNATTPVDPRVGEELLRFTVEEFGNAGSRTHGYGSQAKKRVAEAREEVAALANARPDEVVFTSGATEANNIALLGLEKVGRESGRRHIVSSMIEHKAVLEPLEELARRGFEIEFVRPTAGGWTESDAIAERVRDDTICVSLMHVNNETGVMQPISELAGRLAEHPAYLHVDAAQGFGKELVQLCDARIDLISVSAHKLYAPKGVGALIARRRHGQRPPLAPLMFGGGQQAGLRPGTLPVGLCAAFGLACRLAKSEHAPRVKRWQEVRGEALAALGGIGAEPNGEQERTLATTVNVSVPGVDAEAAMVALKGIVAVSNGSACTSHSYSPSHVLEAMGLDSDRVAGALRLSWSHLTPRVDWARVVGALGSLAPAR